MKDGMVTSGILQVIEFYGRKRQLQMNLYKIYTFYNYMMPTAPWN